MDTVPITAPAWLTSPQPKWIDCSVEGIIEPNEYAVEIQVNGKGVTAAVPSAFVKAPSILPNKGCIRIVVVANLPDGNALADLPASPINGTRRITVSWDLLADS